MLRPLLCTAFVFTPFVFTPFVFTPLVCIPLAAFPRPSDPAPQVAPRGAASPGTASLGTSSPAAAAERAPYRTVALPYHGHGSVTVFREGILQFTVGGETVGLDESGAPIRTESETVAVPLVTGDGLALVLDDEQWRVEERGAAEEPARVLPFDDAPPREHTGLVGLLHLAGPLTVDFDAARGGWRFEILDLESGESLAFVYRANAAVGEGVARALPSTCSSGDCPSGSCSITCNSPFMCQAGCLPSGLPSCACVLLLPPPEPKPAPLPRV